MDSLTAPALLPRAPGSSAPDPTSEATGTDEGTAALASDFETFLTLLTAQMRNQDPLQPIESTEFVAQLASFSTVEQLIATNERLDGLAAAAAAGEISQLASWIGLETAPTDGSFLATGEEVTFAVPERAGATQAVAEIVDLAGVVRASFPVSAAADGRAVWDGRDSEGGVPLGELMRARIVYSEGEEVVGESPGLVYRRIVSLDGGENGTTLTLSDGRKLAPESVAGVRAPEPPATAEDD